MPYEIKESDQCPTSRPWALIKIADGSVLGCHSSREAAEAQMAAIGASEHRALTRLAVECRSRLRGHRLGGYAAVFDQVGDTGTELERIQTGAFDQALKDSDVRALWNHDERLVLGRQSAGTLRLGVDDHGLEYEIDLPDTSYARDVRALVERGDLTGASFQFIPGQSEWAADRVTRVHTSVERLVDISPVTFPAYPQTSAETRAARETPVGGHRRAQLALIRHRVRVRGL